MPALAATPGLLGLNVSITETSLNAALNAIGSQRVLLAHHAAITCHDLPSLTPEQFIRTALPVFKTQHWRGIAMIVPLELTRQQAVELTPLAAELARLSSQGG